MIPLTTADSCRSVHIGAAWRTSAIRVFHAIAASLQSVQKLPIDSFLNYMTGIGPFSDGLLSAA